MKRYHQALCEENQNDKNNSTDSTKNDANGSASILLQTPNVEIKNPISNQVYTAWILLDGG